MRNVWQVGVPVALHGRVMPQRTTENASLREDYLNQVQRDFLSRIGKPTQHP